MKFSVSILLLASSMLLQSCASGPDLSRPEVREAVSKVQFYDPKDLAGKKFEKISSVETKICQSNFLSGGHTSEEAAKTDLKYLASQKGASGIMNYNCHSKGLDLATNCNNATVCYGDAILIKE